MKALGILVALALPFTPLAQQRDVNKPPAAAPAAAGEIAGVVKYADGQPVRRAVITLTGDVPVPRTVLSDDTGAFVFGSLPSGSFSVVARKAAHLAAPYGTARPGRTGNTIALKAGDRTSISLTMFRGAAITGTIRDSAGLPVPGVDVRVIDVRTLAALDSSSPPELGTTDDRGVFRLYNILPGEYVVVALPNVSGSGEIASPSSMDMDATLAALAARGRPGGAAPASPPIPGPTSRPIGYAPVFYPGTPNYLDAARVRVGSGEERAGIDFELKPVPMAAIDAVVVPPLAGAQVTLIPTGPRFSTSFSTSSLVGKPMDAEGKFRYANLSPGRYRLVARVRRGDAETPAPANVTVAGVGGGGRSGGAPAVGTGTGDYLYGYADVELRGEDIAGISLPLQMGGTVTGRIVFNASAAGVKPEDLTKIRITVSPEGGGWNMSTNGLAMGPGLASQSFSTVKPDGSFEVRGIGPGRFNLSITLPSDAKGWSLRSAAIADRDLLDDAIEIVPGREIRDVTVTYSDAPAELSGTLQSATGQPTAAYYIVLLPEDRTQWRQKSRRIISARPSTTGRFVFTNVPTGNYVVAALTDLDPLDLLDASFLEQIAPAGVKVSMAEGEKKIQDLRIK